MAIDFPIAPVLDDSFTADGKTWYWDGEKWIFAPATPETISAVSPITYESITQTIGIEEDRLISFVTSATRPATPVDGQIIFETDTALYFGWNGTEWTSIGGGGGATGGGIDQVFYENDVAVTTSYTISTDKNAMSAGPVEIESGATITIPSGSVWSVV